jgi:hypothetical protein
LNREEIIREIQSLAKSDGKVPGRLRFEAHTGLNYHDWCGKYWTRWNDAIAEAGLSPNEKQEAYPEEILLSGYLGLAIQLNRIPTDADLRMHCRNNKDFPSHSTFQKRYGRKVVMLGKVLDYGAENGAPESILAAIRAAVDADAQETDDSEGDGVAGYVYLLKAGRRYKIGKTTSPLRRLGQLGIELPERAEPIHTIQTDDPSGIEAYWHNRFRDKRLNGEWFELTAADVKAFKRRRKFM